MLTAEIEIVPDGPLGISYPQARVNGHLLTRRFGSWLVECAGGRRAEPEAVGIDPEDLQRNRTVQAFDAERRREREAREAAAKAEREAAEGSA